VALKCGYECRLLIGIVIAWIILMWLLTGCSGRTNRTASVRYHSSHNCEWRIAGGEVISADKLEQEFEVGPNCTLKRKTDVNKDDNQFH
jgi:hypothetical protein